MQGDLKVVEFLNKVLRNELTAINQYFLHARMLRNWGLGRLGEEEYKESLEEMRHADWLIERILFLESLPNLQDLGRLLVAEDVKEVLECDLKQERLACPLLRDAVEYCESVRDYVSRDLFRRILENEEEHVDWLETQLGLLNRLGVQNYQQSMI